MKAIKAFTKPFEAPQRSVKKKKNFFILIQLSEVHRTGKVNISDIITVKGIG